MAGKSDDMPLGDPGVRGSEPARYQSRTPRIASGEPRTSTYSSTWASGRPANIIRRSWPSCAQNISSIWPRGGC